MLGRAANGPGSGEERGKPGAGKLDLGIGRGERVEAAEGAPTCGSAASVARERARGAESG